MVKIQRDIYDLEFKEDDGHFYYEDADGSLRYIPDEMLFEAICSELIKMANEDVRELADKLDRGDVPLDKYLDFVLDNMDKDTDVERVDDWGAVGKGLYVIFGYSVSKWHELFSERSEDVARKYLIKFTIDVFNRPFARWARDNDVFQPNLFLDEVFKFMKEKMSSEIPRVVNKIRNFRNEKVTWLRFLEEVRDILMDINSDLEEFVELFVERKYEYKFNEWRGG